MKSPSLQRLTFTALAILAWGFFGPIFAHDHIEYQVNGIQSDTVLENVNKRLDILMQNQPQALNRINLSQYLKEGRQQVQLAVEPYGYFHPRIQGHIISQTETEWVLAYDVSLGPTLAITRINIQIDGSPANRKLLRHLIQHLPIQKGKTFNSTDYKKSKEGVTAFLLEHGFLQSKFISHQVIINRKRYTAVIRWHIKMGNRFRFGPATFTGSTLDQSLLQSYIDFTIGHYYKESTINYLQSTLMGSGYFSNVIITPDMKHANARHEVPLTIQLTPTRSRHYQLGVGYGTDTGYRGVAAIQIRPLNHDGHQLMLSTRLSQYQEEGHISYLIPGAQPATQHYTLNAMVSSQDNDQGRSDTVGLSAAYSMLWRRTVHSVFSLRYQVAKSRLSGEAQYQTHLLIPGVNWYWTHSDHPTNPQRGYNLNLLFQGANRATGSTLSFFQTIIHGKWVIPLTPTNNQELALRAAVGYTASNEQARLPLQYQFYVGGSQSIRGYGYNSIGPGPDYVVASVEFRQRIKGELYGTVFADGGNTGNSIHMAFKKAVGVGLMYQTIAGNFSASIARPLHAPKEDIKFQFNMSPEF